MKVISVPIAERTEQFLWQFLHTKTSGVRMPLFVVKERDGSANGKDIAFEFSREEAEKYREAHRNEFQALYIEPVSSGFCNLGDYTTFYILLRMIAKKCEAASNTGKLQTDIANIQSYIAGVKNKFSEIDLSKTSDGDKIRDSVLEKFDGLNETLKKLIEVKK